MIGSDPVWPVDRLNPSDEPDTGWQELGRFLDFHRGWLGQLPHDKATAIRTGKRQTVTFLYRLAYEARPMQQRKRRCLLATGAISRLGRFD